jgi:hypothetical protein
LGNIAGAVVDIGKAAVTGVVNIAKSIGGGIKKLFGFAVGTPYVPFDMPAMIHQGEGIIPKTFNEGIQAGDYALVGRKDQALEKNRSGSSGGTVIYVTVNVEGSVVREKSLVAAIYDGIARGIESGELDPLPA